MPTVKTTSGEIYYAKHYKSDNPYTSVMMIHGAGGTHLDWSPPIRKLKEANAIVPDLLGHGKSGTIGRKSISEYAKDVIALADALEIKQFIPCGHSMGGAIAQQIAIDYPERIKRLILIATGAKLSVHPDILSGVTKNYDTVAHLLVDWYWSKHTDDYMRQLSYQALLDVSPQLLYDDFYACNQFDVRKQLSQINAPTLIIAGTADKMTPLKYSTYLADNILNSKLVVVQGAGHMAHLEQPSIVGDVIKTWLNT